MSAEPERANVRALVDHVQRIAASAPRVVDGDDYEDDDVDEHRERGLEAMRLARWRRLIPARFHEAQLSDFDADVRDDLAEWVQRPAGRNLVLLGPVGVGKTAAAVAACRRAHFDGLEVRFAPVIELLDELRPGRSDAHVTDYGDIDRLIIDDLASERATDWTGERLFAVVNRRWLDKRPTIVTTNLEPDALLDAVGERMFSRLVGNDSVVLRLTGRDRRRK